MFALTTNFHFSKNLSPASFIHFYFHSSKENQIFSDCESFFINIIREKWWHEAWDEKKYVKVNFDNNLKTFAQQKKISRLLWKIHFDSTKNINLILYRQTPRESAKQRNDEALWTFWKAEKEKNNQRNLLEKEEKFFIWFNLHKFLF